MSGGLLTRLPNSKRIEKAPFEVFFVTDVPSAGQGNNGDYAFRYDNNSESIYKKIGGTWEAVTGGGGFQGFTSGDNAQIFNLTSTTSSVTLTDFVIAAGSKLRVEKDGLTMYEGMGWTRNVGSNSIDFDNSIEADTNSPVVVFVGIYS